MQWNQYQNVSFIGTVGAFGAAGPTGPADASGQLTLLDLWAILYPLGLLVQMYYQAQMAP